MVELSVRLASLALRNPILSASGTYGHGLEMCHFTPPDRLGGWVSKTVTPRPRPGNPAPRIAETEAGFLNSIGLENKGIDAYVADVLPTMAQADTVVVTNIGGESPDEYVELARRLDGEEAVDALEVNLSCPNVQGGRIPFGTDPENARAVIRAVRAVTAKPIFAKLSPNVTRIEEMAVAVEEGGADGITAVNTVLGMSVDWRTGAPGLATVQGGYSGPAIKPIALRCAWLCARAVSIPVIGCGGIATVDDALEFLVVGCTAVQVGTASFADPALPGRMVTELEERLTERGIGRVDALIGTVQDGRGEPDGSAGQGSAGRGSAGGCGGPRIQGAQGAPAR